MKHKLLISGLRANFTTLVFNPSEKEVNVSANYAAPFNASWVELVSSQGSVDRLVGLSEDDEQGLLYSFEIDHERKECNITSRQPTLGAPAHFITLHDNSALALCTYLGGSVALYPISSGNKHELLLAEAPRTEVFPIFPYESVQHGPNESRQRQNHVHQMIEDTSGLMYAPDLGSDRVWMLQRDGMQLDVSGWLQCPPGTGPRHAVLSPDETIMYVIGELSHTVVAFDVTSAPAEAIQPIEGFAPNVIPPNVHPDHQSRMDPAEICLHPTIPNVLYVSNRLERHIAKLEPYLKDLPKDLPPGDAIAIILLSSDGRKVEQVKHVRTNLDVVRGMRLSEDGKYVVVVGQESGGVEIYEISGERGDVWTFMAGVNEGLESGLKHAVWL